MQTKSILYGDIGATNMRLCFATDEGISEEGHYECADFESPKEVIHAFCDGKAFPTHAVFAIAGRATDSSHIIFTSGRWKQTRLDFTDLGIKNVHTINDFAAIGYSLEELGKENFETIVLGKDVFVPSSAVKSGHAQKAGTILMPDPAKRFLIIGPGTGLGLSSGFITSSGQLVVLEGEGGAGTFAPIDEYELSLMQIIQERIKNPVTYSKVCSGSALVPLFNAIAQIKASPGRINEPCDIVPLLDADESIAKETMTMFSKALGSCAASAALTIGTKNIFIAGGVVPKLRRHFDVEAFKERLVRNHLGANNIMEDASVLLITHPQPGLVGCDRVARHLGYR